MTRDESQQKFVNKWLNNNCHGGLAAVTSYGKTRTSIKCALQSKADSINVIVPTKDLAKQWKTVLQEWKVPKHTVYVVNTAAKLSLNCDLLVIDEAHTAGMADWFQLSWQNASFKKLLWLSATPERKDNKHQQLFKIAPKLMSVTFEEALKNNWIANYTMYNVGIEFDSDEVNEYDYIDTKLNTIYESMSLLLGIDVDKAKNKAFDYASIMLGSGNWDQIKVGKAYYATIGARKKLLYNANNKLLRTVRYIKNNPSKTVLVFSQSQDFADSLQDMLGDICVTIHSGLKDKQREENLKRFRDKRTKVRVISSIKALNEGIDIPELDVGICASGTSSKKDMVQMLGRVVRRYDNKHALFFNLYIKDTQDFYWLRNRQWSMDENKIKWI